MNNTYGPYKTINDIEFTVEVKTESNEDPLKTRIDYNVEFSRELTKEELNILEPQFKANFRELISTQASKLIIDPIMEGY